MLGYYLSIMMRFMNNAHEVRRGVPAIACDIKSHFQPYPPPALLSRIIGTLGGPGYYALLLRGPIEKWQL